MNVQYSESDQDAEVLWYNNDVSGLPRELTDGKGDVAWRAEYRAWQHFAGGA